jgi:ABC-2 type transport system permease protein
MMPRRSVIVSVARAEMVAQVRDGRIRVIGLLLMAACLVAVAVGMQRQQQRQHDVGGGQAAMHEQFVSQGRKNPHSGAHFGIYALRPEGPLGFAEPGLDDVTGTVIRVEAHQPNRYRDAPQLDRPGLSPFPSLSLADLLAIVGPLFIVFLVTPSIAAEREQGTLALLLSQGLRPSELVVGKALAGSALILLTVLPAATILAGAARSETALGGRVMIFAAASGLYLMTFVLLSLIVSVRAATARGALTAGLAIWAATVVVGPKIGRTVAERLVRMPTTTEFNEQVDAVTWGDKLTEWELRENRKVEETMRQYGVSRKEELPLNVYGLSLQMQEDEDGAATDAAFTRLFAGFARQDRALEWMSVFAPVLAFRAVTMASAGTDSWQRADFWWTVERYRRDLTRMANMHMAQQSNSVEGYDAMAGEELWRRVPPFRYDFPDTGAVWRHAAPGLTFLGAWLLATLAVLTSASRTLRIVR